MEKITITEISEDKFGKPNAQGQCAKFWGVKLADGRSMTVWSDELIETIRSNINVECEAEIKTTNGFSNIRAFVGNTTMTSNAPVFTPDTQKETKTMPNPQRVGLFIKLAVEMMIASPTEGKNIEENLCENIQEIKKLEEFTIKLLG